MIATGAAAVTQAIPGKVAASDRIQVAALGVNGRGRNHIQGFQELRDVEIPVVCDPDREVGGQRAPEIEKGYGKKVDVETDLRKAFTRKDIGAVSVATPNHWHSLATIWACQAGKDVYARISVLNIYL